MYIRMSDCGSKKACYFSRNGNLNDLRFTWLFSRRTACVDLQCMPVCAAGAHIQSFLIDMGVFFLSRSRSNKS